MYHNIEKNVLSTRRTWQYIGYAASGRRYMIAKDGKGRGYWRAAQTVVLDNSLSFFTETTLREVSARLEKL